MDGSPNAASTFIRLMSPATANRPARKMDEPAHKNPPLVSTEDAVGNIAAVVDASGQAATRSARSHRPVVGHHDHGDLRRPSSRQSQSAAALQAPVSIAAGSSPFAGPIPDYRIVTKEDERSVGSVACRRLRSRRSFRTAGSTPGRCGMVSRPGRSAPDNVRRSCGRQAVSSRISGIFDLQVSRLTIRRKSRSRWLLIQGEWDADTPPYMARKLLLATRG